MDSIIRKNHPPSFKAKVALEAIKEAHTMAQLATIYGIHVTQIRRWKQIALEGLENMFSEKTAQRDKDKSDLVAELYRQIGQLKVELDWLKKKMGMLER